MPCPLDPALAAALAGGFTLLTPNQRAAYALRRAFDHVQLAAGITRWTPPQVFQLETWLAHLWHQRIVQGSEDRTLLNRSQEQLVWRALIAADPKVQGLRSPSALADLAAHAWSLLCLYGDRSRLRDFALSQDAQAFSRWARAFANRLQRERLLTAAQLPRELARAAAALSSPPLALVDFDFLTPALQGMLDALRDAGVDIQNVSTAKPSSSAHLLVAEDDMRELQAAASWARKQLDAKPAASIAIVAPDLNLRRASIERVFAPVLSPEQVLITAPPAPPGFEFSLGTPLASLPIARVAIDLLHWTQGPLSLDRISALLLSPWLSPRNLSAIAEFDVFELRQLTLLRPEFSLEATIKLASRSPNSARLADLLYHLRALDHAATQAIKPGHTQVVRQPFAQWSSAFGNLLEASGWTRRAGASSLDFQQHRRFDSALDQLASLDAVHSASANTLPGGKEALAELTRILEETLFAPESQDASVQILGPLELGGVAFDALWFLGADDLSWPAIPASSPLLPWQLRRALGTPGADRTRDDTRALALTRRVAGSAAAVVFSYARNAEDGERRPSPLLSNLGLEILPASPVSPSRRPLQLVTVADDLMLPALPFTAIRGGARVLKHQAACAFRAFAEHRLWSVSPSSREPGLSPLERGDLVHKVMQHFWTELQTQTALRALSSKERTDHLARAIALALADSHAKLETSWDRAYISIQRQRLHNLLAPWLQLELERPQFTVQDSEQKKSLQLGPLQLALRIDRIDSTVSGDVILDYKTGSANPSQWDGDRPDDPQVPLYALIHQLEDRKLAAVAFVLLQAGDKLGMTGYADAPSVLGSAKQKPLHGHVDSWRVVVTRLAEDFAAGRADVLPKAYPGTCRNCGQRMLCRLNPETIVTLDESEDLSLKYESEPAS